MKILKGYPGFESDDEGKYQLGCVLGYNDFDVFLENRKGESGNWFQIKFYKTFIKNDSSFLAPFLPRLALKFAKSAFMTQKYLFSKQSNNHHGYQKTQFFWLISDL
jgi:hypothetical protein